MKDANITPVLIPLSHSAKYLGITANTLKALAAADENFPRIIKVSPKKMLVKLAETIEYLHVRSLNGEANEPIRVRSEEEIATFNEQHAVRLANKAALAGSV